MGKKDVDVKKIITKARKAWFLIQKILNKSKEKTFSTNLKLMDSLTKKYLFCNKVEKFHSLMCKQILIINKNVKKWKV